MTSLRFDHKIEQLDQGVRDAPDLDPLLLPLQHDKVVLIVDLVESVRLMSVNEVRVVGEWHRFVHHAQSQVIPHHGGRLVKSLGDGLLAEFDHAVQAVRAALSLQTYFHAFNAKQTPAAQMHLRSGLHATHLYVDTQDVYGHGVNLAARVADLGEPGDTVITAAVRDAIVDGVDGEVEDMGESHLKHWPEPVRTWRVRPVIDRHLAWRSERPEAPPTDFRPSIAVIPFEARNPSPEHFVIGELIADGVIAHLARSTSLRVISRLSTTAFRGRQAKMQAMQSHLNVGFILSGGYSVMGEQVVITAELSDARRNEVLWADRISGGIQDLMQAHSQLMLALTDGASQALIDNTVQRSLVRPVPQLDSTSLLLGSIALMHRSTARDLDRSRELLDAVTNRHRRVATPWAWTAKWHILNIVQGRSANAPAEFSQAIDLSDRALDLEPHSSLALAIKGHVQCHLGTNLDASRQLLLQATEINPNDANAWLYAGFWSTMWGDAAKAIEESVQALELSPLDPQRFFIEMLVAHAYLAGEKYPDAIALCEASLRKNRCYLPTLRALLTAQYESGQTSAGLVTARTLQSLQPHMTVSTFLQYGSESPFRVRAAKAMAELGMPK
jgi:adenylate cyclase